MNNKINIEFFVIAAESAFGFACQFIETKYNEGKRIFIQSSSKAEAERIDALLWTYSDSSFLPHQIYEESDDNPPPIQVGYGEAPAQQHDILINLSREIPNFFQQFDHVVEIVFSDPVVQQLARDRYKRYRDLGFEIKTTKI